MKNMALRRMFSKTITNSGKFIKMPASSRLLYYDLGMNADDDGFCEWYTVIKMTGSTEQDLGVLEANGFVKRFDENVLVILNWKENNYIQKDRYTASKYLNVYKMDTECIQDVSKLETQVRLGEVRVNKTIAPQSGAAIKIKKKAPKNKAIFEGASESALLDVKQFRPGFMRDKWDSTGTSHGPSNV